jgi:hypothetical protein
MTFLTILLVGGGLIALLPEYTRGRMASMAEGPVSSFLYGLFALLALIVGTVVLVPSLVGILVAIPLALVVSIVWALGAAIGYLAIADRLVGREDGWLKSLVAAAVINSGLTLTGVGGLLTSSSA